MTRIEGKFLMLYKDKFNLNDAVLDIVNNYKNSNGKSKI